MHGLLTLNSAFALVNAQEALLKHYHLPLIHNLYKRDKNWFFGFGLSVLTLCGRGVGWKLFYQMQLIILCFQKCLNSSC